MTSVLSKIELDSANYDAIVAQLSEQAFKPLTVDAKSFGCKISFLFERCTNPLAARILELIRNQYNCKECAHRAKHLFTLTDIDNNHLFFNQETLLQACNTHPSGEQTYKEVYEECNKITRTAITGLHVLHGNHIYGYAPYNADDINLEFKHWNRQTFISQPSLTELDITKIQFVINRYIKNGHMFKMIQKIATPTVDQGLLSLKLMETCCKDLAVTYGNILLPALRWLKDILSDLQEMGKEFNYLSEIEKWSLCVNHLMRLNIAKDFNGYVCLIYQTSNNNIVDLLTTANDVSSMKKMIAERVKPENYQRRDETSAVKVSPQQINQTEKILGDFENKILSLPRLEILVPQAVILKKLESIKSAYDMIREDSAKTKTSSAGGFASRSGFSEINDKINKITTFSDLVLFMRENPTTSLKIHKDCNSDAKKNCYVAETNLGDKVRYPHLWAFGPRCTFPLNDNYYEVSAIVPMYQYIRFNVKNILFTIAGASNISSSNCCFPEFLTPEYERVCGPVFAKFNQKVPITIPSQTPLACGIGFSSPNEGDELNKPVKFLINGIVKEIRKF